MNQSILYWKWEKSVLGGDRYKFELESMLQRNSFKYLYISFHHLGASYDDGELYDAIKNTCAILERANRKLILDIDARNEFLAYKDFGGEESSRILFCQGRLNESGECVIAADMPKCGRVGRGYDCVGAEDILGAWCFEADCDNKIVENTIDSVNVKYENKDCVTEFFVSGGKINAGKNFVIAAKFHSRLPDIFSEEIYPFYDRMFEFFKDLPLGGVANDEWGNDLILDYDNNLGIFSVQMFPYSQNFAKRFEDRFNYSLRENLLYFTRFERGNEGKTYQVINDYLKLFRLYMKENNDWFYEAGKRWFGQDTFIGVHCTYWGDPYDFGVDILHNAIDWWEVRRDFAQTDEYCIYPIRLAMMHRWNSPYWYNMWYSGNTQQIHTYYEESWKNIKFGGRTDYLGYECVNETGVVKLRNFGMLEAVESMERNISKIDDNVKSQPNSSVGIIFGMESISNWMISYGQPKVTRGLGHMAEMLQLANGIFSSYNCDLIPSSDITNGSVALEMNRPVYGSQRYDALVLLSMEGMDISAVRFLSDYLSAGGKLIVMGECSKLSGGEDAAEIVRPLFDRATFYSKNILTTKEIVDLLTEWEIPSNRVPHGCVYQDDTIVLTAEANLPINNYFESCFTYRGYDVCFRGNDYCVLNFAGGIYDFGKGSELFIDGKLIEL